MQASELSEYAMNGHLGMAVRASNAQYDVPEILDRLRVRLPSGSGFETGSLLNMLTCDFAGGNSMLCADAFKQFRRLTYLQDGRCSSCNMMLGSHCR